MAFRYITLGCGGGGRGLAGGGGGGGGLTGLDDAAGRGLFESENSGKIVVML